MKKTIKKEAHYCDVCNKEEDYISECLGCGKEFCFDCKDKHGYEYSYKVYFRGWGDGYYCNECIKGLTKSKESARFNAYLRIQELKEESESIYDEFKKKQEKAEKEIEKFLDK
jgi:hypothetical protein